MITGLSDTTPAAPSGAVNVKFQQSGGFGSAYIPLATAVADGLVSTGAQEFSGDKQWDGFAAFAGTPIHNSDALGYVVTNVDYTRVATTPGGGNEVRGCSYVMRLLRTGYDEQTLGWDCFGGAFVVVADAGMNMPSDPIFGSPYLRGHMKGAVSELYFQPPITPYTAHIGYNFEASLEQVGSGVTLQSWYGLVITQPGTLGSGGNVTGEGYGIYIQNLDDDGHIIDAAIAAAIKINGLNEFGRILWNGSSIYETTSGDLAIAASTVTITTGLTVGIGSPLGSGVNAGNYALSGTSVIFADSGLDYAEFSGAMILDDRSSDPSTGSANVYLYSKAGELYYRKSSVAGSTVVGPLGASSFPDITDSGGLVAIGQTSASHKLDVAGDIAASSNIACTGTSAGIGFYQGAIQITAYVADDGTANPRISLGNLYNVDAYGDVIVHQTTHHVGSAGGYYVGATQIVDNSRNLINVTMSASLISGGSLPSNVFGNGISTTAGLDAGSFSLGGTEVLKTASSLAYAVLSGCLVSAQLGSAPSPASGYGAAYFKSDGLYFVLYGGSETKVATGTSAVSSVFGRTGAVTATSGDYSFSQISGTLSASTISGGSLPSNIFGNGISTTAGISGGSITASLSYVAATSYVSAGSYIYAGSYVNAVSGFQVNGSASVGYYLRGNGTNFVASLIQTGDIPSGISASLITTGTMSASLISGGNLPSNIYGNGIATSAGISGGSITASSSYVQADTYVTAGGYINAATGFHYNGTAGISSPAITYLDARFLTNLATWASANGLTAPPVATGNTSTAGLGGGLVVSNTNN